MEFIFSAIGMILVAGFFVTLVVACGTMQLQEQTKRREAAKAKEGASRSTSVET